VSAAPGREPDESDRESVYGLYQRGMSLLEQRDFAQATIPLGKAARLAPDKSSIREALGRAYFSSGRFNRAVEEFAAVVERYPVNDFAHFCLGRALTLTGRPERARRHLAIAATLRPDRRDYRVYRERLEA
jgi:Flp pilus assembly protein TadD